MRAITYDRYGSFDVLNLREIDKPAVHAREVRVRIRAVSVQIGDVFGGFGEPLPMRIESGLFKPKRGIPGYDFAGEIDAVGPGVTDYEACDAVFGHCGGVCAEYACAPAARLGRDHAADRVRRDQGGHRA
jgi:NADPH:quinone reductase-like Zn-dependent oxidoreductase